MHCAGTDDDGEDRPCIDVFNGDADGICALQQLRLHRPCVGARLVTGVKRDIALLQRLADVRDSRITVLDISLDRNRDALLHLLAQGNRILYVDHHFSGEIPSHPSLEPHIDPSPLLCTSLIIDQLLGGRYRLWAIVGAFGDNLDEEATALAADLHLAAKEVEQLKQIGRLLNYNGYGMSETDLHIHPRDLFTEVNRFTDPWSFMQQSPLLERLRQGFAADMALAGALQPHHLTGSGRVFVLPPAAWARRVVGVFANQLAREQPTMAHATLIANPEGSYLVSVRAPLASRQGADSLCRQFPTGGGRAAAAGINALPASQLDSFLAAFADQFDSPLP